MTHTMQQLCEAQPDAGEIDNEAELQALNDEITRIHETDVLIPENF